MAHWIEELKQGKIESIWEATEYFDYYERKCSWCGRRSPADSAYPYCPYCGVEMENFNVDLLGRTM